MKSIKFCYALAFLLFGSAAVQAPVILWTETTADTQAVTAGNPVNFSIVVTNDSAVETATNPVVTVTLPAGAIGVISSECVVADATTLNCMLSELTPKATVPLGITAVLNNEGHNVVDATVSSDQDNFKPLWRREGIGKTIVVVTAATGFSDESAVDLAIEVDLPESMELNTPNRTPVTLKNLHESNTAVAPVFEYVVPMGWDSYPGKHCTPTGETVNAGVTVRCLTAPLAPGSESKTTIVFRPVALDGSTMFNATASSTQPDDNTDDNSADIAVAIVPTVFREILCGASNPMCSGGPDTTPNNNGDNTPANEPSESETQEPVAAMPGSSGGGGSLSVGLLFLMVWCCAILLVLSKRRRSVLL